MEWIVLIVVAIGSWAFGVRSGERSAASKSQLWRHEAGRAEDRAAYLRVVSRELGNLLIWENPDNFLALYRSLHAECSAYNGWKPEALQQKYDKICKSYEHYSDFDVIGTRPYVLYPSTSLSIEEIAGHYGDIARFVTILSVTDKNWRHDKANSDQELTHLEEYVQQVKDIKFKLKLQRAIQDYRLWSRATNNLGQAYESPGFTVQKVFDYAENLYGVHFNDTGENGVYGFYVHDDGHISYNYYRSDASFENRRWLMVDNSVFRYFGGIDENSPD